MTKIRLKKHFLLRQFYAIFKQKSSNLRSILSITFPQGFRISRIFGHWTSGSGGKKTVKLSEQMKQKSVKKKLPRQFYTIVKHKNHFFPLLFPKDSEYLKFLDIALREVGAKRPLNGVNK